VQRSESDPWQGSGTLLLVDDDEDVRAMAKKMLEHLGFEVLTAENASARRLSAPPRRGPMRAAGSGHAQDGR
jgi:ActR/RegA family two-component response regulator